VQPAGIHAHAELAAGAAEAVGRFWEMHDQLFEYQDELEPEDFSATPMRSVLDVERFARSHERHAAPVREDVAGAETSGVRGTPTFFIGERRHVGPYDAERLARELGRPAAVPDGAARA
jgi:protein-disulfide isomerase